jgi:hypothetical protein
VIYKDPYSKLTVMINQRIDWFIKTGKINHFMVMMALLYERNLIEQQYLSDYSGTYSTGIKSK